MHSLSYAWLLAQGGALDGVHLLRTFGHPGAVGSVGWEDTDIRLAVAIAHNWKFRVTTPEENPPWPLPCRSDCVR